MDATERVEIAVLRTLMVEQHARKYEPFGYRVAENVRREFGQWAKRRLAFTMPIKERKAELTDS